MSKYDNVEFCCTEMGAFLQNQINQLRSNLCSKNAEIKLLQTQSITKNEQLQKLQRHASTIISLCANLQSQIAQYKYQNTVNADIYKTNISDMQIQIDEQNKTILTQQESIQIFHKKCETLQTKIQSLQQSNHEISTQITTQHNNWQIQIRMNKSHLDHEIMKSEELQKQLHFQQSNFRKLECEFATQQNELFNARAINTQLIQDKNDLKRLCQPIVDHLHQYHKKTK
eukprot:545626_1